MNSVYPTDIISEIKKCALSFAYFCKTYVKFADHEKGLINFELRPYQEEILNLFNTHQRVLVNKCRQGGFTKFNALWSLWTCLFSLGKRVMIIHKTDREAWQNGAWIRRVIQELPTWMQPVLSKENDHELRFDDTDCVLSNYKWEASCGRAIDYLFVEEAAFVKDMEQHWNAIVPTIYRGKAFIVSTPNGKKNNWFYETCKAAWEGAGTVGFHYHAVNCTVRPDYSEAWVAMMKKNLGDRGFRQECMNEFLDDKEEPKEEVKEEAKDPNWHPHNDLWHPHNFTPSASINRKYKPEVFNCYDVDNKQAKLVGDWEKTSDLDIDVPNLWDLRKSETDPAIVCYTDYVNMFGELEKDVDEFEKKRDDAVKEVTDFAKQCDEELAVLSGVSQTENSKEDGDWTDWLNEDNVNQIWKDISDAMPEFSDAKLFAGRASYKPKLLKRDSFSHPDMLALSGIPVDATDQHYEEDDYRDLLLKTLSEGMPNNMELDLRDDALCINGVPTKISTKSIEMAFEGLVELTGTQQASLVTVGGIIKEKLQILF